MTTLERRQLGRLAVTAHQPSPGDAQ